MRGLRTTIALLVVLIGLGAYIYFVTSKMPDSTTVAAKDKVFTGVDANGIVEMVIKAEGGDTTTLKKENGAWQLTMPITAKAEDMETSQLTSNLSTLEVTRIVDANPTDLNQYGLQTPRIEVDFKSSNDKDYHRLFIGEKSPTGGDLFAKRDADKRVILIPGYTETMFNRTTLDLRDKILVRFDREKVDRIALSSGGKTLELVKDDNLWNITKPIAMPGDSGAADALLGRLQTAAVKSVVAEQAKPEDLKKYGFDKPQGELVLSEGGMTQTFDIGGKMDDNTVYIRDISKPLVSTIDVSFLKELQKSTDDYRRKDFFAFKAFNVDRLELTRDGQAVVFERVKSKDTSPDKWHRVSPNPGDPNSANMESLIAKLENLRAASFVDAATKTGLDKPTLTVSAKFDDDKKEDRVTFSKVGDDVYAAVAGQSGAAKVTTTEFDETVKALDEVSK